MNIAFCSIAYNRTFEFTKHINSLIRANISYDKYLFCDFAGNVQDEICAIAEGSGVFKGIIKHEKRLGLRSNIMEAIRMLTNKGYDWVCIFEDDVLIQANFEDYLKQVIHIYPDVAHISLWTPKIFFNRHESYKSRVPLTGGGYVVNSHEFSVFQKSIFDFPPKNKFSFNLFYTYNYTLQYERNISGEINTWAVLWYSYIYSADKFTVSSGNFWTSNIGFDGSGTNTKYIPFFEKGIYLEYEENRHNFRGKHFDFRMAFAFILRRIMKIISKFL